MIDQITKQNWRLINVFSRNLSIIKRKVTISYFQNNCCTDVLTSWSKDVKVMNLKKSKEADFTDVTTLSTLIKASTTGLILASKPWTVSAERECL